MTHRHLCWHKKEGFCKFREIWVKSSRYAMLGPLWKRLKWTLGGDCEEKVQKCNEKRNHVSSITFTWGWIHIRVCWKFQDPTRTLKQLWTPFLVQWLIKRLIESHFIEELILNKDHPQAATTHYIENTQSLAQCQSVSGTVKSRQRF